MRSTFCEVNGCGNNAFRRQLCHKHYARWRYHGTTDLVKPTEEERFWRFVERSAGGCWEWSGCRDSRNYGLFNSNQERSAHRYSYFLANGPIPSAGHICHHCDNPPCVNPAHLFLGDDAINHADMVAKGRSLRGERNIHARLSAADVVEIRRLASESDHLQREIAEMYGVSRPTISDITHRRSWGHLA